MLPKLSLPDVKQRAMDQGKIPKSNLPIPKTFKRPRGKQAQTNVWKDEVTSKVGKALTTKLANVQALRALEQDYRWRLKRRTTVKR